MVGQETETGAGQETDQLSENVNDNDHHDVLEIPRIYISLKPTTKAKSASTSFIFVPSPNIFRMT